MFEKVGNLKKGEKEEEMEGERGEGEKRNKRSCIVNLLVILGFFKD